MGAVLAPRLPRPPGVHAVLQRGVSRGVERCACLVYAGMFLSEARLCLFPSRGINIISAFLRSHQLTVYEFNHVPFCQKPGIEADRFVLEVQIGQFPIAIFCFASFVYLSPDVLNKCLSVYLMGFKNIYC